eukprot:1160641-Pelagomonas_calceolata.AAC.13
MEQAAAQMAMALVIRLQPAPLHVSWRTSSWPRSNGWRTKGEAALNSARVGEGSLCSTRKGSAF